MGRIGRQEIADSGTGITVCTPMLDAKGGLIESCPTFLGWATSEMSRTIMPAPP